MNVLAIFFVCTFSAYTLGELSPRIVGGSDANLGEFAWQGSLQMLSGGKWYHYCGCALYTATKALSAAHCLTVSAENYRVVFGLSIISQTEGTEQYSAITSYINHPGYDGNANGYPNDIAVLKLATAMESTWAVKTIHLATGDYDWAGSTCTISGWGRLSGSGSSPDKLQKAVMKAISNNECKNTWPNSINPGHVCIFEQGKSGCFGDSGGPMECNGWLVGITSWVEATCSGNYPTVYSRVSYFNEWIQKQ